jgi:PAS domain S-box-containing protein
MSLKTGILFVGTIVAGCLIAIYLVIPEEKTARVLQFPTLEGQQAQTADVGVIEIEGQRSYLRSTFKNPPQITFLADLVASTGDSLRMVWRSRGRAEDLRVDIETEETVFSTAVEVPPEGWKTSEIKLDQVLRDSTLQSVDRLLKIKKLTFLPVNSREFELHFRDLCLVQPTPRWKAAKVVLSVGGFLILAMLAISLVAKLFRTEKTLKSSDSYYRSIFNAVSEGIFVLDTKNGTVLDVNEKACQIFDQSREAFLASDVAGIIAGTIKRDPLGWIRKAIQEEPSRFEWRCRTQMGRDLWLELNLRRSAIGGEERLLAVVRDIGEEKQSEGERQRLEQQLLHSQKLEAIGQLAGGVAHDFNNILTSISCSADLALRELQPRSIPAAGFRQISDLTQRATSLTRQLLAFSRQQALRPTVQSANQLIDNALKMLTRMIGEEVQLQFRSSADRDIIRADAGQIEQVLMNLAINARDAMPGGGTLTLETSNSVVDKDHPADVEPGAFLKISVTDTGEGMDQETRERLFEPFFTTKEVGKGTGLGLSTVYGIVRQHRGDILFDSQLGEGTVFHIFLPLADEEVQQATEEIEEKIPGGSETILLVEDDPNAREIIERVLRTQGYKVFRAGSAREAVKVFEEHGEQIDLLLTDIVMPGENGVELLRKLQEREPLIKVLFMSGYTARGSLQDEVLRPGLPFIPKPFGPPELARKIREALEFKTGFEMLDRSPGDDAQVGL